MKFWRVHPDGSFDLNAEPVGLKGAFPAIDGILNLAPNVDGPAYAWAKFDFKGRLGLFVCSGCVLRLCAQGTRLPQPRLLMMPFNLGTLSK